MKPIRGGLLSGLVAALLLLALSPATSWATYPGANGRIAYSETRWSFPGGASPSEILTISPAGGDPTQLTNNRRDDIQPSWSADGSRIAFMRWDGHDWEVWTMRADGTHERQVTDNEASDANPYFSPSGGRILMTRNYLSPQDWSGNIFTVRTDGTDSVRLLYSRRGSEEPEYSPDGRQIVFDGSNKTRTKFGIWKMRRNGSHRRLLTDGFFGDDDYEAHPDFSPSGSHIVYERCDTGSIHGCFWDTVLMRSGGRFEREIPVTGNRPAFSPDGKRFAVIRRFEYDSLESWISTVSLDGSDSHTVTQVDEYSASVGPPSWQPILVP